MKAFARRWATIAALILIAVVCSGCGGGFARKADSSTQFTKASPDAIVVMGLQSARRYTLFGIEGAHPPITMHWGRLEPGYRTPSRGQSFAVEGIEKMLGMHMGGTETMTMHVMRIPAGTYMLHNITTAFANNFYNTVLPLKPGAPFFTIKPGEVRYIGDLHIDAVNFPAKIVRLTRSDLLAKAEIYKSPGIHVPPFFQGPAYFPASDSQPVAYPVVSQTTKS